MRHGDGREWRCLQSGDELEVQQHMEDLARRLDLPMIDMTGPTPTTRRPEDADVTLRERLKSRRETRAIPRPAGCRARVRAKGDAVVMELPTDAVNPNTIALFVIGAIGLVSMGFLAAKSLLAGDMEAAPIFGGIFAFSVVIVAVAGTYMQVCTTLVVTRDKIALQHTLFGRRLARKEVDADEVEDIRVSAMKNRFGGMGEAIAVRSDRTIIKFGLRLSSEEKAWLIGTLIDLVAEQGS